MGETKKDFYLTFDGAPHPPGTDRILEVLSRFNAPATFFMEGKRIPDNVDCAKKILHLGHDIGNHSFTHPNFDEITKEECREEITKTENTIERLLGFRTTFLRPPSGRLNSEVEKMIMAMGYTIVLWSYSIRDWEGPDAESLSDRVIKGARPESVVVFHDHISWNPETLKKVIPLLLDDGYNLRKISEHPPSPIIR